MVYSSINLRLRSQILCRLAYSCMLFMTSYIHCAMNIRPKLHRFADTLAELYEVLLRKVSCTRVGTSNKCYIQTNFVPVVIGIR